MLFRSSAAALCLGCGANEIPATSSKPAPTSVDSDQTIAPSNTTGSPVVGSTSTTGLPTTTNPPTTTTSAPPSSDAVAKAGNAYYQALQSGSLDSVLAIASTRCDVAITASMVRAISALLKGVPATVTVLSIGENTASVNIDSPALPGNSGKGTQFRLENGEWLWDGCP